MAQIVSVVPANIVRGPAWIKLNSLVMYTEDDIIVDYEYDWEDIKTSAFGPTDIRLRDRKATIKFTPQETTAAAIPNLWPYVGALSGQPVPQVGSSATGLIGLAGDGPPYTPDTLEIMPLNSGDTGWTFHNVFIAQMPDLHFANGKNWFGSVTVTAIGNPTVIWSNAASFVSAGVTFAADTNFLPGSVLRQGWTGVYTPVPGAGGGSNIIDTNSDGFTIRSSGLVLEPVKTNNFGTVDYTFGGLSVEVEFTPTGTSSATIATMLAGLLQGTQSSGTVSAPGVSGSAYAAATAGGSGGILTLTGSAGNGVVVNGLVPQPQLRFGSTAWRAGPIKLKSTRVFSSGVPILVFSLS